ncbi:hypothetical protein KXW18_006024 [Aspergillus fumigatus]|nr:hypothetical protein KXV47_004588 [Aspergillus fumigatus]KAH2668895.1 hypothetical protein KXV32_004671 [Aspergillus fumigatus]KAH3146945.1 hypothetical protein KXW18_006024 [Aspergillus fumigatus]
MPTARSASYSGELFALKAILEQMQEDHSDDKGVQAGASSSSFQDALLKANTVLEEILDDLQRRTTRQSRLAKVVEKETAHSIDAVVDWSREMKQLRKGKTVLCSTAIEAVKDAIATRTSSQVIYYYCSFHLTTSQELVYLLGALLVQLSESYPEILDELQESFKRRALPQPDELVSLLLKFTKPLSELFIVVDAINESRESAQILDALLTLLESSHNIQIMVTSTTLPPVSNPTINILRLTSVPALQRLPEHIKCRIKTVLLEKAGGMFRYVQCQIEPLAAQKTGRDVILAFDRMPESLHGTYETILCRIPSYDREIARETLLWLSSGYQEITLAELSEAVVLTKGDKSIDDDCRLFDPQVILSICQGLIVYDERTTFVALAHSSVKAFLTSDAIKHGPAAYYSLDETEGFTAHLAKVPDRRKTYPLLKYAAENWASHCSPSWPPGYPLVDAEMDGILSFFDTRHLPGGGNYTSWTQMLLSEAPAEQARRTEPLYYAASYGILPLVDRLIQSGANVNAAGGRNDATPLIVACFRGQEATVQRLLEAGADPIIQDAAEMCSLEWAVRRQHRGTVEILLSHMRKSMGIGSSDLCWQCRACKYQNTMAAAVLPCASCGIELFDQRGIRLIGSAPRKSTPQGS